MILSIWTIVNIVIHSADFDYMGNNSLGGDTPRIYLLPSYKRYQDNSFLGNFYLVQLKIRLSIVCVELYWIDESTIVLSSFFYLHYLYTSVFLFLDKVKIFNKPNN